MGSSIFFPSYGMSGFKEAPYLFAKSQRLNKVQGVAIDLEKALAALAMSDSRGCLLAPEHLNRLNRLGLSSLW